MGIVRILQVGDIHYPSAVVSKPLVDLKRDPFSISGELAPEGLRFQKITQTLSHFPTGHFHAIVFMGDFTDGSPDLDHQITGMKSCLDYVHRNILAPLLGRDSRLKALFVPGNHDVDRTKCPTTPDTRAHKFEHYFSALSALGQTKTSAHGIDKLEVANGNARVNIYGINTCLGCGEYLSFPKKTKSDLVAQLALLLKRGSEGDAADIISEFLDLTEQLDAPFIAEESLNELDLQLGEQSYGEDAVLNIVVGHHNLLPQPTPRVAPFSELVNSGKLRSFLATKDSPIVYLHGHIHQDPIEIVYSQDKPDSCVISIAAPEFLDGYNILQVEFDDDGSPLGIIVIPIRQDKLGKITKPEPSKIPFRQGKHRIAAISSLARDIFYNTFSRNSVLHFNEICKIHSDKPIDSVEHAVTELEWLRLVEIDNRPKRREQWNVRSAV